MTLSKCDHAWFILRSCRFVREVIIWPPVRLGFACAQFASQRCFRDESQLQKLGSSNVSKSFQTCHVERCAFCEAKGNRDVVKVGESVFRRWGVKALS